MLYCTLSAQVGPGAQGSRFTKRSGTNRSPPQVVSGSRVDAVLSVGFWAGVSTLQAPVDTSTSPANTSANPANTDAMSVFFTTGSPVARTFYVGFGSARM
jgi:hypothetical protein